MSQNHLNAIDMLKIDVERAELDVLAGVQLTDWPKIQQLVLEVHDDSCHRLQQVTMLLRESAGFEHILTEQTSQLQGSNMYTVFCSRRPLFV